MDVRETRRVQSTAMSLIQFGPVLAGGLFVGVLAFLELGRRIGRRRIASERGGGGSRVRRRREAPSSG